MYCIVTKLGVKLSSYFNVINANAKIMLNLFRCRNRCKKILTDG